MQVLAALGDAPTAALAVLAIVLGVFLAARGPREERFAEPDPGGSRDSGPKMLKLPLAAAPEPEAKAEPGFVGPQGEVVGHGPIRLGATGPLGGGAPAAADPAATVEPEAAPATEPEPERQPDPEPASATQPEHQPEPEPEPAPEPPAPEPPAPEAPAAEPAGLEASPAASEQALFTSPPTLPDPAAAPPDDAVAQPAAPPDPPPADAGADADADAPKEPAWRVFRQGTIKLGGKPVNEPKDQDHP